VTSWPERSRVHAAYLNPALVAAVIAASADGYASAGNRPMIWPLAFVAAPLVLHRPTRDALPASTTTHLVSWVSKNAVLRAGFPARAQSLAPTVREGIRFGIRHNMLSISGDAIQGTLGRSSDRELTALLKRAHLVGRWLAKTDQPATVFAIFGVEP
jgi:Family of unknown function (DUF6521)